MTLFSLTAILGESTDALATVRLFDAPMAFDQACAALGRIPKPLRCTAELEGRELVLAVGSLDPKLDGERPLYMATTLPELERQYLAEKGSIQWRDRRVRLRGVGEQLIVRRKISWFGGGIIGSRRCR